MYPAIFGKTYATSISSEVFAAAAADGFAGVQFNLVSANLPSLPTQLPPRLPEEIGASARRLGVRIAALSGTYNMAHPDKTVRTAARPGFLNVLTAARRMAAPIVTLCTGSRDPHDMWKPHPDNASTLAWIDLLDELEFALDTAAAANIKLAVEPEPGNVVRDARTAKKLLEEIRSPNLGIVLDAANLLSPDSIAKQDIIVKEAVDLLRDRILLAHAKDIDAAGRVVAAGEGAVDLKNFVKALRSAGFDGALIGHGFAAEKSKSVAHHLSSLIKETA